MSSEEVKKPALTSSLSGRISGIKGKASDKAKDISTHAKTKGGEIAKDAKAKGGGVMGTLQARAKQVTPEEKEKMRGGAVTVLTFASLVGGKTGLAANAALIANSMASQQSSSGGSGVTQAQAARAPSPAAQQLGAIKAAAATAAISSVGTAAANNPKVRQQLMQQAVKNPGAAMAVGAVAIKGAQSNPQGSSQLGSMALNMMMGGGGTENANPKHSAPSYSAPPQGGVYEVVATCEGGRTMLLQVAGREGEFAVTVPPGVRKGQRFTVEL